MIGSSNASTTFRGLLKGAIAFSFGAVLYSPVTGVMFTRAAIGHDVINPLDVNDTASLKNWPGSNESFLDMLHERCLRIHDRDATSCVRYLPR